MSILAVLLLITTFLWGMMWRGKCMRYFKHLNQLGDYGDKP